MPYSQMKSIRGNIMWPVNVYNISSDSKDDDNALLGYVSSNKDMTKF